MILKDYIEPHRTISIIGIAKNAGKTTVLNTIIDEYKGTSIGITSIGLDGEKIDNVTNKPKPRIKVYPKTIIATANDCLIQCEFNYVIHEQTEVRTPLGPIMIVEAVTEGYALVAGPSTNNDMVKVINKLKKYSVKKIFIDGALYRKSIASFRVADACILATGASYDDDINIVVEDTKILVNQLHLEHVPHKDEMKLISYDSHVMIDNRGRANPFADQQLLDNEHIIGNYISKDTRCIFINGALTDKMIDVIIEKRHDIDDMELVVNDATHILASPSSIINLSKTNVKLMVLNKLNLLFLTYNPVSPNGTVFNNEEFKTLLESNIDLDIFNVLKD